VADHVTLTVAVEGGRTHLTDWQKAQVAKFLATRNGKSVLLKISAQTSPRSVRQNAYYWGVCLTLVAASTGHATEEIHKAAKDILLPRRFIKLGSREVEVTKTTCDLTTTEFELYLNQFRAWAENELGVTIPLPNE
jgi:hypothetical protein